jgi:NAD(P)-dependent dehydrogenase (short-subunit alcohol dehydrogenase family)
LFSFLTRAKNLEVVMAVENQKPLGSGFGAKSSSEEIMRGVDLSGKNAIVTGGYSGIGLETTKALKAAGANVIVPVRNKTKADENFNALGLTVETRAMDLADLASVQAFAADVMGRWDRVDLLINNAGIMACPETRVGPGWEAQFAVNHIGHFVLTRELAPCLKEAQGARVVSLSSLAHKRSPIRFEDIHFTTSDYQKWDAYAQSKTANALFALELNRQMESDGVKAFSVHPGGIMTPLQRHLDIEEMVALGWVDETGEIAQEAKAMFKTPEQGCTTTLWCATSAQLNDRGGEYCEDCDIAQLMDDSSPRYLHVAPWAADEEAAARLWVETEKMLAA